MRRFPRSSNLKCLTAFVTYVALRSMAASVSARSSILPAGPTNGSPMRSSWSPGCSPTNRTRARWLPAPNTVCVAFFHRGQARQWAACSRTPDSESASTLVLPGLVLCCARIPLSNGRTFGAVPLGVTFGFQLAVAIADLVVVEIRQLLGSLALFADALQAPPRRLAGFHDGLLALVEVGHEVIDIEVVGIDGIAVVLFIFELFGFRLLAHRTSGVRLRRRL